MAHLQRKPISGVGTRVYVIMDARGYVKVGVSKHPQGRAHSLAAGNPTTLRVVYETKPFSRAYALALEAAAHDFLAGCNLGREWFSCEFRTAVEALHLLGGLGDDA